MKDAKINVSAKGLVYVFVISIVFFALLDVFAYVNTSTHRDPVYICNNPKPKE